MALYPILRRRSVPTRFGSWGSGDLDQVFDRFFGGGWFGDGERNLYPAVDVREDSDAISVQAELPGLSPEDVRVKLENGVLTLSGEKQAQQEKGEGDYHFVERQYGKFLRSFTLPDSVDVDKIDASYSHGVLTVTLPKLAKAKPRSVEVKVKAG